MIKTDAGRDLCTVEGENGNTPLHSACEKGDLEIAKVCYNYVSIYIDMHTYTCIISIQMIIRSNKDKNIYVSGPPA